MLRAVLIGVGARGAPSTPSSPSLVILSRSLSTALGCSGDRGLCFDARGESFRARAATAGPSRARTVLSPSSPSGNLVVRRVSPGALSTSVASSPPSPSLRRSFAADAARSLDGSASPSPRSKVVPIPLAQTGEGIKECELVSWRVREGDTVEEFGPLCEVQSDKAAVEITARHAGVVERLCFAEGDMVEVGATLCELRVDAEEGQGEGGDVDVVAGSPSPPSPSPSPEPPESPSSSISLASPAVRRVAKELGLADLSSVVGTGPGGRILKGDVERHAGGVPSSSSTPAPSSAPTPAPPTRPQPPTLLSPEDAVVPLRGYRRSMVSAMESSLSVPHFHYMDEYDVGSLIEARKALANDKRLLDSGIKLTLLPFVVKAISLALSMTSESGERIHALVNASLSPSKDSVITHGDHNVGVAVDTPRGLVVPVVRRVQDLSVAGVASELARLQRGLSENGALPEADLRGATVTVSNIGSLGGAWATPLVHPPQAAIVALGRVRPRLVVVESGEVEKRGAEREKRAKGEKSKRNSSPPQPPHPTLAAVPSLPMSWGADHRVVDGAGLARFAADVGALLSEPARMLLHSR